MFKKVLLWLGTAIVLGAWSLALVNAQANTTSPNFGDNAWFWNSTAVGIGVWGASQWLQWWSLISIVKNFINWVLWILSLVVLVIVLIGWFQMVTAQGDENKYKKWFTILKHAGIGLVVIWLSWFIVSIIFWIIWSTSNTWSWWTAAVS